MEDNRTAKPRSKAQVDGKSVDRRTPRTIRFTDSEWEKVSQAATAANISTATFARNAVLNAIADPAAASGSALTAPASWSWSSAPIAAPTSFRR